MIKILFVFGGIPQKGGTEAVMSNIYENIDETQFHIDFMFFKSQSEDNSEFTKNVLKKSKVFYVPCLRDGINENHRAIKKVLKENKYDIIHTHMDASGTDVLNIAKQCGIKIRIAHSHNTAHMRDTKGIKQKLHKLYLDIQKKRIKKHATHFVSCSDMAGEWLFGKKICNSERYITFKNAIDTNKYVFSNQTREKIRKELGLESNKVIGHIGRFSYQKNHPYLIEIFKEIYNIDKTARLLLIGDGEDKDKIERQVQENNLTNAVIFFGTTENVPYILQAFDVFVFPSHYEGLSVALMEAQASGLKCLVSDTTSKESKITDNVEFLSINESPRIWAKRAIEILNQKTERISPIETIINSGFDMKTNIIGLEKFYNDCMAN